MIAQESRTSLGHSCIVSLYRCNSDKCTATSHVHTETCGAEAHRCSNVQTMPKVARGPPASPLRASARSAIRRERAPYRRAGDAC